MFQVEINVHDSKSNCETCGYNSATVITIKGDLGEAEFGEGASCFSGVDADWHGVALWLCNQLNIKNKDFPELLNRNLVDSRGKAYAEYAYVDGKYVEDEEATRLMHLYYEAEEVYDNYYSMSNILRVFAEFDIYFDVSYSEDEDYDFDDYEEEECQDE